MADVVSGAFQLYSLRWIGGNEDPIFLTPPFTRATFLRQENRSFYSNPRVDSLIDQARRETDQDVRKKLYAEIQEILAKMFRRSTLVPQQRGSARTAGA